MIGWLASHFGGGALSLAGHVATEGVKYLRDRVKAGEIANIEQAVVQKSSYAHRADWEHLVVTLAVLGLTVWAHLTGQPDGLQHLLDQMAVTSVAWFTGRIALKTGGS